MVYNCSYRKLFVWNVYFLISIYFYFSQILDEWSLYDFFRFIGLLSHHLHKLRHVLCKLAVVEGKLGHGMCIWHVNNGLMESLCIHATEAHLLLFINKSAVLIYASMITKGNNGADGMLYVNKWKITHFQSKPAGLSINMKLVTST